MNVTWRNSGKFDKEAITRGSQPIFLPTIIFSIIAYSYFGWISVMLIILASIIAVYFIGKHTKSMYCSKHDCPIEERHFDYDIEYYCPTCHEKEVKEYKQQVREARISEYEEGAFRALQRSKQTE